jgi:hypothetical protein
MARHAWLVRHGLPSLLTRLESDPNAFDAKIAGWWVWGIGAWIGSDWRSGSGPWAAVDGVLTNTRQLPHLGNRKPGPELPMVWTGDESLLDYLRRLARRLRHVRVCCGDWWRVVTDGALAYGATVGVFLDQPYSGDVRYRNLYRTDDHDVADDARRWAVEHGDDPRLRIVLCGYEAEHAGEMPRGWRCIVARGPAAYQTAARAGATTGGNQGNRRGERLWLSTCCLVEQASLFADDGAR